MVEDGGLRAAGAVRGEERVAGMRQVGMGQGRVEGWVVREGTAGVEQEAARRARVMVWATAAARKEGQEAGQASVG